MRKCPSCGYGNPAAADKCAVCGRDVSGVVPARPPAPPKRSFLLPAAALALLACAGLFYLLQSYAWKAGPAPSADDDEQFSYEGVVYSLEKTAGLRYLPEADKRRVLALLSSPDERAAYAAAKAAGTWARAEGDSELGRALFEGLLGAASSGRPAPRRQAALEAGFILALGFPAEPYAAKLRLVSAELVKRGEVELRASGYFLSAMAGMSDFVPQMRETLAYDPSYSARLYAACALSRLGDGEGNRYVAEAAAGKDPSLRAEALSCLSYSASPEAERLLLSASADRLDIAASDSAKRALMLRKQLAIIKK